MIGWMFGLYYCPSHETAARRDCNAHCHREKILPMSAARREPVLAAFLAKLDATPFVVQRTNGDCELDWSLDDTGYPSPSFIQHIEDKGWYLPVKNPEGLTKAVPITDTEVIAVLDAGVYAEDAAAMAAAGLITIPQETVGVRTILHEGRRVRVHFNN